MGEEVINGLSLFTGVGGLDVALSEWVRPMAYCEIDPYCQGVLFSQIYRGRIADAPIWPDIRNLDGLRFRIHIDIIYGGFPCQGVSIAGLGKGLADERSGLFFEIIRLAKEIKPTFIFLENVPAITSRGGLQVVREITEMGYDCRWCVISAASVGALHLRERWFLLAHARSLRRDQGASEGIHTEREAIVDAQSSDICSPFDKGRPIANPDSFRESIGQQEQQRQPVQAHVTSDSPIFVDWENTEPPICGVATRIPHRLDRVRAMGNAVVPRQAKEAFKILMGIE